MTGLNNNKNKKMEEISGPYNPQAVEKNIYTLWQKKGFFNPDKNKKGKKAFCVVLPPPNVTGSLHMGHALNAVIQDILIRFNRMKGVKALWVPGTDHASIALQNVVEKKLRKEGVSRHELGRDKFIEKCWDWRNEYGNIILNQLRTLGASCDWSRAVFTMDPNYVKAVEAAFIHYHKKGLVYRGERVVNWCPRCSTSLSDLELEHAQELSKLWYLKYPLEDEKAKYVIVATTRPETMLGDTAVAVNPKDDRYKKLVGKQLLLPIVGRRIKIVADELVDPAFGTGAVKVTPAHDLNDWQIGQRHKLEMITVIGERGRLNENVPASYRGLKVLEAREKIVSELAQAGLLEKSEEYSHQVPKCYRCGSSVELIPSKQWFLKMEGLAKSAIGAVRAKKTKFHPRRWEKVFFDWQKNTRDWCISRQLWWGQAIPVWFCTNDTEKYTVSQKKPKSCPFCKNCQMERSEDVFDTWFSSALWPLAVFGWPKATKDFKTFYPTSVLSTARDIINLWVARMIFSGLEFSSKVPFSDVIIHATVLTRDGRRMSKSLGTGIDPMAMIEKYGSDAVRFGLAWQITETQDIHFNEDNMVAGKKFANKIWNASRFVLNQCGKTGFSSTKPKALTKNDGKIIKALTAVSKKTNLDIENYRFGSAIRSLYEFFWHDFCDIYVEKAKIQINEAKTAKEARNTRLILSWTLYNSLKLLHPFMPFISEEIWGKLPKKREMLIVEKWPDLK